MTGQLQPGGLLMPGAPRPQWHPYANLFPMLDDVLRASFRASLAQSQNHPIVLHKGMILDGRNRERELVELGKPVAYSVLFGSDVEAFDFVMAENLERRHLKESVRAMIAARAATLRVGANQYSAARASMPLFAPVPPSPTRQPAQICAGEGQNDTAASHSEPPPTPTLPHKGGGSGESETRPAVSQSHAAKKANVSRRLVQSAAEVHEKGAPELVAAVMAEQVTVSAAVEIASLPLDQQRAIIAAADPKAVKAVAKTNRVEKLKAGRERRLANMTKGDATPLLDGGARVGVFYVDIPREFESWSDAGAEKSPEMHYRTERLRFLADLREKILARAEDNAVMIMWAWANSLQDQLDLLAEWGFASVRRRDEAGRLLRDEAGEILAPVGEGRYRSHQVWVKRSATGNLHQGMGFWFIDCHELILIGCRGDVPAPLQGTQAMSVIEAIIGAHSEKPNAVFRDQIDHYFPGVRKLELFGRVDDVVAFQARWPDWEVIGNDTGSFSLPPQSGGEGGRPQAGRVGGASASTAAEPPPTPAPSPPLRGGRETERAAGAAGNEQAEGEAA